MLKGIFMFSTLKSAKNLLVSLSTLYLYLHLIITHCHFVYAGVVNRKSDGHIGCLVHGLFNVTLHKPFRTTVNDWLGKSAKLLDKVRFTVKKVDLLSQVPYIEGVIVELM